MPPTFRNVVSGSAQPIVHNNLPSQQTRKYTNQATADMQTIPNANKTSADMPAVTMIDNTAVQTPMQTMAGNFTTPNYIVNQPNANNRMAEGRHVSNTSMLANSRNGLRSVHVTMQQDQQTPFIPWKTKSDYGTSIAYAPQPGCSSVRQDLTGIPARQPENACSVSKSHVLQNGIRPGGEDVFFRTAAREQTYDRFDPQRNNKQRTIKMMPVKQKNKPSIVNHELFNETEDMTREVRAAGTFTNPYTNETFQKYENKLPPPNTRKGELTKESLSHINPKLLWVQGGYNHHNPPPAKREHAGHVFKPVVAGGRTSGTATDAEINKWNDDVRRQQTAIALRDTFNHRNGNIVTESKLVGRPKGYFGLNPRVRYTPVQDACNELPAVDRTNAGTYNADGGNYVKGMETTNPMARPTFKNGHYGPESQANGVDAFTKPGDYRETQRVSDSMKLPDGAVTFAGPSTGPEISRNNQTLLDVIRNSQQLPQTAPTMQNVGNTVVGLNDLLPTMLDQTQKYPMGVQSASAFGNLVKNLDPLAPTQKEKLNVLSAPSMQNTGETVKSMSTASIPNKINNETHRKPGFAVLPGQSHECREESQLANAFERKLNSVSATRTMARTNFVAS